MDYCEAIKKIIMNLVINEEIELDDEVLESITYDKILPLASIDKVKLVIQIESMFDIVFDDTKLSKLQTINDFNNNIIECIKDKETQKEEIEKIIGDILTK